MARTGAMPATTSIWGSWPGGATAMIVMAAEFGADARLVAFMHYFRIACIAGLASVIAAFSGGQDGALPQTAPWFPPLHWRPFATALLTAAAAAAIGRALRVPSGPLLLAIVIGAALNVSGPAGFELPRWLLTGTNAILGWSVGLRFTPGIMAYALKALPKVLLNVALLIAFSACVGFLLARALGVSALTAYLATSPGAMESIAIIAISSGVDVPFVVTLQTVRFLTIVAIGTPIARFLVRRAVPSRAL